MGSVFINAGLAAGVALAAVPVILHLFMKQTPKHVIFPALRLIKERQKRSKKRLRIKNWLLLLARMALLALMALALARPRIDARASLGTGEEPTAMALVFDTSLSMGYKERDRSRLDDAKDRAREVLHKVNEQSKVFVIDSADPGPPVASSPSAARKRIDGLAIRAANRSLNGAVGAAYTAVAGVDLPRREVYILTDLAASQWQTGQEVEGREQAIKSLKSGRIDTFVLRVGAKEVRDVAIVSAEPASPIAVEGQPLALKVRLRNVGPKASRRVEYFLDGEDSPRDKRLMEIPANSELEVPPLVTPKLDAGLHRIAVKLVGEPDPMEFDDARYLTVEVQPPIRILVIQQTKLDGEFVTNALSPPYQVERVFASRLGDIESRPLRGYAAVFLLNVKGLEDAWWSKLTQYVREGGGLVVAPGGRSDPANYNGALPAQLLPARLKGVRTHPLEPPFTFGKPDLGSPIFAQAQKELLAVLAQVPIFHSWAIEEAGGRVLLRYSDETPALLEKPFPGPKPGRVLLWTTELSRSPEVRKTADDWNEFPMFWGFLAVMDQTVAYLSGASGQRLVYETGEDAALPLDPGKNFSTFSVIGPNGKAGERTGEVIGRDTLLVASPGDVGQWTVNASSKEAGKPTELGFSVNPPRAELQTSTLDAKDLDVLFGKGKYQLAENPEELKRIIATVTYGREIFPWVMALILLVVTLENLLANTFYREKTTAAPRPAVAA